MIEKLKAAQEYYVSYVNELNEKWWKDTEDGLH
jgi:hypothetical protein